MEGTYTKGRVFAMVGRTADKMAWKSFCSGRLLLQNDSQVAVIGAKTTDILHFVIFLYFSILIGLCQR